MAHDQVQSHNPNKYPASTISSPSEIRQAKRDIAWAKHREQLIAGAAAGVHLALFSFNLAFWGFEGMPPDRYNPSNIRCVRLSVARTVPGFVPTPLPSFSGSSLESGRGDTGIWMGQSGFIMTISQDWRARIDRLLSCTITVQFVMLFIVVTSTVLLFI